MEHQPAYARTGLLPVQCSHQEGERNSYLPLNRHLQCPYLDILSAASLNGSRSKSSYRGHRQYHDPQVDKDIEYREADKNNKSIDAVFLERSKGRKIRSDEFAARCKYCDEEFVGPCNYESDKSPACNVKESATEHASVEEKQGKFQGHERNHLHEIKGKFELEHEQYINSAPSDTHILLTSSIVI
jgi:hypothetical protein